MAITDPGSPLVEIASERGFRHVFENDPDIGGRYSVLSHFGLVPAVLAGVNIEAMLHRAQVAEQNCAQFGDVSDNSGLWLGVVLGELALLGRDKVTFVVSEPLASLGLWLEQLVAESTGKQGKGVLPVAGEPLGPPEVYGDDRVFIYLRDPASPKAELDAGVEALGRAGHPTVTLAVHGAADLGRIFFFAEFARRGRGLGARHQPVRPAQRAGGQGQHQQGARRRATCPRSDPGDAATSCSPTPQPPHYVAILGYVTPSDEFDAAVDGAARGDPRRAARRRRRSATGRATCTRPDRCTRADRPTDYSSS